MYLKAVSQVVTESGTTPPGVYSVSLMNTGVDPVFVGGVELRPGGVIEFGGYGLPIGPVSYDATGSSLRIDYEIPEDHYNDDTVNTIITTAASAALRLDINNIQEDVIRIALGAYNLRGRMIWDSWKWDQTKLQEYVVIPDADNVATMPPEIDVVRAVYAGTERSKENGTRPFNEEQRVYGSARPLSATGFEYMADDYLGRRRIKFSANVQGDSFTVLGLRRFRDAIIDPKYEAASPYATPADYRVQRWVIDRAKPALILFIEDRLRDYSGQQQSGDGAVALQVAVKREENAQIKDNRITPSFPQFGRRGW